MKVSIESPRQIIQESLTCIVTRDHTVVKEVDAEVTVKDLTAYKSPYPPPPISPTLALIGNGRQDTKIEILELGYEGYLLMQDGEQQLKQALEALLRGEKWVEQHIIIAVLDKLPLPSLTKRESEIYTSVLKGLSNREIAQQLGLSINTVKVHVSSILQKMNIKSRRELMIENITSRQIQKH